MGPIPPPINLDSAPWVVFIAREPVDHGFDDDSASDRIEMGDLWERVEAGKMTEDEYYDTVGPSRGYRPMDVYGPYTQPQPLPWEAAYEPGNVSDYLVGHYATEQDARTAAEEWFRAQRLDPDEIGPLIWDDYGQLGEFYGGVETDTGLVVRRRQMPNARCPLMGSRTTATPPCSWPSQGRAAMPDISAEAVQDDKETSHG